MICRRWTIRATTARRAISICLLLGMLLSAVPIPLSSSTASPDKDRSKPFPCQNRPCGCQTAEQCWKECCCFTDEQKLAWAERNRVNVPQFVIARARSPQSRTGQTLVTLKQENQNDTLKQSCCSQVASKDCSTTTDESNCCEEEKPSASRVVIGFFAQECQGNKAGVTTMDWVVPAPMVSLQLTVDVVGESPSIPALLSIDVVLFPAVPPPRAA